MTTSKTTEFTVPFDAVLTFGHQHEHFADLVRDEVCDKENVDDEDWPDVLVTEWNVTGIAEPNVLVITATWIREGT